jgi:ankyrin repeat protein
MFELLSIASLDNHLNKQSGLVEEHLREVKRENAKQDQRYQNNQHRQCHRTFKTSTYEQFKDFNPDRVKGTCQWVLSHPQYLQWYTKTHDDLLWISADPGCGKSVLAKSLIENEIHNTDQHTVCYFFFKDNEEQDNLATALCALLYQLFTHKPQLIPHAIPAWEKTGEKLVKEVPELWRTLIAAARDSGTHDVTCVLDALDECRLSDRRWLIEMLSRFYTQIRAVSSATRRGRLKFLVTSRPYDNIQADFRKTLDDLPTIRLRGEEENDKIRQEIDMVIRMRVAKLATDLKLDGHTKEQLKAKLLKMEHRTYLWLYLAIEGIYKTYQNSLRPEKASIKSLPSSVEDAYEKILSRVGEEQRGNVKKILQIVVGARRPLTVQEMAMALGIATSDKPKSLHRVQIRPTILQDNIRDWCGLFVFINHDRIYLIHQTAKEFLIRDRDSTILQSGWRSCLSRRQIEKDMTQICVEFLCLEDGLPTAQLLIEKFKENQSIDDFVEKDDDVQSLLVYSAEYWSSHLRDADIPANDFIMPDILRLYDTASLLYSLWFSIFWEATYLYDDQPRMNSLQLAALLGHGQILKAILQSNQYYDIDEPDNTGRTGLIWASELGHEKVVQMLMDAGADVNAQGGKYGNALQAASFEGYEKVVQMLIDEGADIKAQSGSYGNALQAASYGGHKKGVQMLIDAGADINAQSGNYDNALQAASVGGHEKVVQILIDAGADIKAQGGEYGNALQAASFGGHEKIVQILMDAGADIKAQSGKYGNTLQAALVGGHEKVVQMLIDEGADINA